jgi:hypothetical protein
MFGILQAYIYYIIKISCHMFGILQAYIYYIMYHMFGILQACIYYIIKNIRVICSVYYKHIVTTIITYEEM